MTEEEKQAVEYYTQYAKEIHTEIITTGRIKTIKIDYPKLKTILNLISKLQKEIYKLKDELVDEMTLAELGKPGVFKKRLEAKDKEIEKKDKVINIACHMINNYDSQLVINRFKDKEEVKEFLFEQVEVEDEI